MTVIAETDNWGNRLASGAHQINLVIDETWRTVEDIARRAGNARGAVYDHLQYLHKHRHIEKRKNGRLVEFRRRIGAGGP